MINAGIRNRLKQNIASNPSSSQSPRFSDLFILKSSPEDSSLYSSAQANVNSKKTRVARSRQQKPRSSRIRVGWICWRVRLVGACRKHLPVAQAVHVAEQWRSGRQTCRIGEVRVENIVTRRRLIHRIVTALE